MTTYLIIDGIVTRTTPGYKPPPTRRAPEPVQPEDWRDVIRLRAEARRRGEKV